MVHRVNVTSVTFVSTKYRWLASSRAMSPSSPKSCCSRSPGKPGMFLNVRPSSVDHQVYDIDRVPVGAFASGPSASCQFSLWAVTKMLPKSSTYTAGS